MFDNFVKKKPEKQNNEEQFLLVIGDIVRLAQFYLLVPGRKEFAELLNLLSPDKYVIMQITLLTNVKKYDEFLKLLKEESKPDGLNFGKE